MAQTSTEVQAFGDYVIQEILRGDDYDAEWSPSKADTLQITPVNQTNDVYIEVFLHNAVVAIQRGDLTYTEALRTYVLETLNQYERPTAIHHLSEFRVLVRHKNYLGAAISGGASGGPEIRLRTH